jgi:hypothetical protein
MAQCKSNNAKEFKPQSTTVANFFIPSQIKQNLFLFVVTCVGDCYIVIVIDMAFSRTIYKYSI